MTEQYTLRSLCVKYDKIEIPIIQRDYAQGREHQKKLRDKFVAYLLEKLTEKTPIVLDFVYGNLRTDKEVNQREYLTFIPIDGQQRLTTLWLLHWLLAVKEGRLEEESTWLQRFTYETRPAAHSFCECLMKEHFSAELILPDLKQYLKNQPWFAEEWLKDGTVKGMLEMLHTFSQQKALEEGPISFEDLRKISFYFLPLETFGLSEDLYVKMNARGKQLTPFEHFKSEFYKILQDLPYLEEQELDSVKGKMEYLWVEHLWDYREGKFVTDDAFMNFLGFLTRALYFKGEENKKEGGYTADFTDFKLLAQVYAQEENLKKLIFTLDHLPTLKRIRKPLLWKKDTLLSLADILFLAITKGEKSLLVDEYILLYAAVAYLNYHPTPDETLYDDYLRVVRNLIHNTGDKSEREQPNLLRTVEALARYEAVYKEMAQQPLQMQGFFSKQAEEEHLKAQLIVQHPEAKELIEKIEDHSCFEGNIRSLLEDYIQTFDAVALERLFERYKLLSKDSFNPVWGDLLDTSLYTADQSRMKYASDYTKHPAIIELAKEFSAYPEADVEAFIAQKQRRWLHITFAENPDPSAIQEVKKQLYLLYLISRRVMNLRYDEFFKGGCWNFGWLPAKEGYASYFTQGIEGYPYNEPIFQVYCSDFRYNSGLKENHSLPPEILKDPSRPEDPWEALKEWVEKSGI